MVEDEAPRPTGQQTRDDNLLALIMVDYGLYVQAL